MADDDLQNYKLQLQQVESALLADPENTDLLKLRKDLEEIIDLTTNLTKAQSQKQKKSSYVEPSSTTVIYDEIEAALIAAEQLVNDKVWKIGDKCQAKWREDGQYYNATIEGITGEGEVSVTFDAYKNRSTTTIKDLKPYVVRNEVFPSNKRFRPYQKEYFKKRKQRKLLRVQELEEEREQDKNNWLNFTTKQSKKSGVKVKSIFATTENANGRVGIGTCGLSGKPMTDFSHGVKHHKSYKRQ